MQKATDWNRFRSDVLRLRGLGYSVAKIADSLQQSVRQVSRLISSELQQNTAYQQAVAAEQESELRRLKQAL